MVGGPPLLFTHRSRGMESPEREDGGASVWAGEEEGCRGEGPDEWAGLGNRDGEEPRWPLLLPGRGEEDVGGCFSIRHSASLPAAEAASPGSLRPLRLRLWAPPALSLTRLPRGRVMPGRDEPSAPWPSPLDSSSPPWARNGEPGATGARLGGPLADPSSSFSLTEFRIRLS